ncbi:uncharacterized protein LOC130452563 [Diorhabda sublineata]|uniref:uncharacterized protein LOC130452563 n=1 Tax=Diorhabda sublineata TaxID=1163346 RepID=UPI0024E1730C|nr:uncharacterized protein LOC130452563 [Diorhabda sublineata]
MNKLVIFSVFLVICGFANAGTVSKKDSSSSSEELKELASLLESKFNITIIKDLEELGKKAKAQCPNIETQIEEVGSQIESCIEDIELGSDTFCSLMKKNLAKCAKPGVDLISSCLPAESKELPTIAIKVVSAIIDQACRSTVEEILELFNPCILETDISTISACTEIKTVLEEHRNKLPSKSLVCSTVPKVKSCSKAHREASCKNPITNRVAANFQDAIEASIKDVCDNKV